MSVAYLLDPTNQYQNRAGVNNVNGYFEVFEMNTDDRATVYTDFAGTLAPARIGIDNNGRAVMIVESGIPYRVEMHEPNGDLVFTQQPVYTVATGGGASVTRVTSTDGSIGVEATTVGSVTTYDLSSGRDSSDLLEWVRCDGAEKITGTDVYRPTYTDGTLYIGEKGIELGEGRYYHVTAHIRATKNTQREPFYDKIYIGLQTNDGTNTTQIARKSEIIDYSLGLTQEFEFSTDVCAQADCELELVINGSDVAGGDIEVVDVEAHRIFSGSPAIPSGVLSRAEAAELYQRKLIAGQNITITPTEEGDIIASTGGGGGGGGGDNDKVAVAAGAVAGYLKDVLISASDMVSLVPSGNHLVVNVNLDYSSDPKLTTMNESQVDAATSNYGSYQLKEGVDKLEWGDDTYHSFAWLNAQVYQCTRLSDAQGTITRCNLALCGSLAFQTPAPCFNVGIFDATTGALLGQSGLRYYGEDFSTDEELCEVNMIAASEGSLNIKRNTRYIIQIWTCGLQLAALDRSKNYNYTYDYTLRQNLQTTTNLPKFLDVFSAMNRADTIPMISFGAESLY